MPHPKQIELRLCDIGRELLDEVHPPESSRAGRNTVYHFCEVYQGRPSYASCLFTLQAIKEGRDNLRPFCADAVRNGTCPAVQMERDEFEAGRALFYVDYVALMERRRARWLAEAEDSPIQFRRKPREGTPRFVPTYVPPLPTEVAATKAAPETKPSILDHEIDTNIFEQLVKTKVGMNDES